MIKINNFYFWIYKNLLKNEYESKEKEWIKIHMEQR